MGVTALTAAVATAHAEHGASIGPTTWLVPVLVVAVGGGVYLAGVRALRRRRGRSWSRWRTASWLTGTALVALALSPVPGAAADGARGHMVEHVLIGMLGPLGLVTGAPVLLLLGATPRPVARAVTRVLGSRVCHVVSHPVVAAALSVGGLFVLYLTPLYAASARHEPLHHLVHVHFLAAGYLFAWSVAGPDPAPRRPGLGVRVTVLVLAAAAHGFLAKTLYARAGELPPGAGHDVADLQAAAQWMYYGGDVAELMLAAALFATWYRHAGRRPASQHRSARVAAGQVPRLRPRSR